MPPTLSPTFDGARTIPSQEVTDLMLELLQLTPSDKVMEIGTGSGYQTQRFAETGAEVHSIELEPWIDTTVIFGGCVYLHHRDGLLGLPEIAPFTAIVATCGVEQIPAAWAAQLSANGRAIAPIGDSRSQRLTLFRTSKRTAECVAELSPVRVAAYVRFQMMREKPKPIPPKYQPVCS